MKRKAVNRTERFAAVILGLKRGDGSPIIDREAAKTMTAKEIVERFEALTQDDHVVHVAIDGDNHPTNLTIMPTAEHGEKTATRDIPQIAKTRRLSKAHEAFRAAMLAKHGQEVAETVTVPKSRWGRRPMPGSKESGWKKPMQGPARRRAGGNNRESNR